MALYLQMDGVDDKLTLPSLTFNQILIDGVFDSTQSTLRYIFQTVVGTNIYARLAADDSLQLLGVTQTGFALDTRTTMTLTATTNPSTSTLNIFVRSDGGASFAKGKLYSIKFFNGATLVAHYDMSTGTVQDQSGNGNHATLTGGTWVDDGTGGGTGTAGSITFDTKQVVYKSSSTLFDTLQRIYKTGSAMFDTKQAIYKTMNLYADLLQRIYKPSSVEFETKQIIHKQSQVNFDTLQQIYKSGSFDANILIRILEDFEVYDQIINEVFKINPVLNYEFTVTREIQKDFKINREVNKTFKI